MNKSIWQQLKPHAIAIAIFFVISVIYCLPALKGLQPSQHDILGWTAMSQQSREFKEQHGHYPLWTNSMLSGMPAYQIAMESKHNVTIAHLHNVFSLFLPVPAGIFFVCCVTFYILCMVMGLRSWVGILGALGYAYASYTGVAFLAGHLTKLWCMAYAPGFLAGLILLTQRKYVTGFVTTLVFATLLTWQNHLQILYYTMLVAGLMALAYMVYAISKKEIKPLFIAGGLAAGATALGVLSFAVILLPTSNYAKESIRGGGSRLTPLEGQRQSEGGLERNYAFTWSYGVSETFTLIVPRIFGGGDPKVVDNRYVNELGEDSKTAEALAEQTGMPEEQANEYVQSFSTYWGAQPGTSGTVYLGAVICFLLILGLVLYRSWHLAWIVGASILGILLSWGSNFSGFNYFLFDHLPFYNKFRAPAMALVIPQLTFPLLAAIGLNLFITEKENRPADWLWKKLKTTIVVTAGVFVVLAGLYFTFDYRSARDQAMQQQLSNSMLQQMSGGQQPTQEMEQRSNEFGRAVTNALKADRQRLYSNDLLRSLLFVTLAAGLVYAYSRNKLSKQPLLVGLVALSFIDLILVDTRYLNHNSYDEAPAQVTFTPSRADQQILQDTGYYRVLDQSVGNPFLDSRAAYFHNSVGGQHPARLVLYDDLIQRQLTQGNMKVYNMLNTKYFIVNHPADRQPVAQVNPLAMGPCWLVRSIRYVKNADEEMNALNTFEPADTVLIDNREKSKVTLMPEYDSAAYVKLVENVNDQITYDFESSTNQFAVFSEIYYPLGWKAFIDGKEVPIVRVNYALRGLPVPAGKHAIEFRFEPRDYMVGDRITLIIGIISILALLGGVWWEWRNYHEGQVAAESKKQAS